jgi:hypothetical protein
MSFKDLLQKALEKKAESTEAPKLETFMKPAVEETMKKQLDADFRKDEGNHPQALRTRQPTIVKTSSADFYIKTAEAACRLRTRRKLRAQDMGVSPMKKSAETQEDPLETAGRVFQVGGSLGYGAGGLLSVHALHRRLATGEWPGSSKAIGPAILGGLGARVIGRGMSRIGKWEREEREKREKGKK